MPLAQDRSPHLLASSPACYHCATDAPHTITIQCIANNPTAIINAAATTNNNASRREVVDKDQVLFGDGKDPIVTSRIDRQEHKDLESSVVHFRVVSVQKGKVGSCMRVHRYKP